MFQHSISEKTYHVKILESGRIRVDSTKMDPIPSQFRRVLQAVFDIHVFQNTPVKVPATCWLRQPLYVVQTPGFLVTQTAKRRYHDIITTYITQ